METTKEYEARESAARTLRFKLGKARDEAFSARGSLKNIEAALKAPTPDVEALREIVALSSKIPAGLVTVGNRLVPGGQNLQVLIAGECELALGVIAQQRADLEARLPAARDRVVAAEARLKEFEG